MTAWDSDVELPYPNSFRYRNWVIDAFNKDMPFYGCLGLTVSCARCHDHKSDPLPAKRGESAARIGKGVYANAEPGDGVAAGDSDKTEEEDDDNLD